MRRRMFNAEGYNGGGGNPEAPGYLSLQFLRSNGEPVGFVNINSLQIMPNNIVCYTNGDDFENIITHVSDRNTEVIIQLYDLQNNIHFAERYYTLIEEGFDLQYLIDNNLKYMMFTGSTDLKIHYGPCWPIKLVQLKQDNKLSDSELQVTNSIKITDWHANMGEFVESDYYPGRWGLKSKNNFDLNRDVTSVTYDSSTEMITVQLDA